MAERSIDFWCGYVLDKAFRGLKGWELQNMLTVAKLMTLGAGRREATRMSGSVVGARQHP